MMILFMYLLLAFAYQWIAWFIPPLVPFSTINNISISLHKSDDSLDFFKAAFHANPGAGKNEKDQTHVFQDTYSEGCSIHQLAMMCSFEHTNHDIHLDFLFQNLYKLFLRA